MKKRVIAASLVAFGVAALKQIGGYWANLNELNRSAYHGMVRSIAIKRAAKITISLLVVIAGSLLGLQLQKINVLAQDNQKTIELSYSRSPQVKIKEPRVGMESRTLNEKFRGDADWIRHTSFRVENTSGFPITYLKLNIVFPDTRVSNSVVAQSIFFGRRPGSNVQQAKPFALAPGGTLAISLSDEYLRMSGQLSRHGHSIEKINQIQIEVGFIVFADGIAWSAGTFMRQDPNNLALYHEAGTVRPEVKP